MELSITDIVFYAAGAYSTAASVRALHAKHGEVTAHDGENMQNKHLKLLRMMIKAEQRLTAKQLAASLAISDRSVKTYIAEVNFFEPGLITSSRSGYQIDPPRAIRLLQTHAAKPPQRAEQRVHYLLTQLLNNHSGEFIADITLISQTLCISDETIRKDLFLLRKKLKEFDLYLNVNKDQLTIEGHEQDKRKMFSAILYGEFSQNILSLSEISKIFPDYNIDLLVSILVEACKSFHYVINEYALFSLVLDMVISIDRTKNNYTFTQQLGSIKPYGEREVALAKQVIRDIEQHFLLQYNAQEAESVTVVILSSLIKTNMDGINIHNLESIVGKECMTLVSGLRQEMQRYDFIDHDNHEFMVKFTLHIKNLLFRLQYGYVTRNPLTEHIKSSCPLIFECAIAISSRIKQQTGYFVDEHEIAYIALHIGSILGTQVAVQNKVTCVLLVPHYHASINRLVGQIPELFSRTLLVQGIVNSYQEFEQQFAALAAPDFLISTVHITQTAVDWLYINPFLTDRDIAALQYKIERIQHKKKRARLKFNLLKISDQKLFFRNQVIHNEQQAIPFMAEALHRQGYVEQDFVEQVFQREHSYSTNFANIAVPHSMQMNAKKTGLCILINQKPLQWGGNKVNVVLLFSINQTERELFYDIFDNLIVLLLEPPNLQKVLHCQTYHQFVETVVGFF